MKKKRSRLLSSLLAIIILLQTLPLGVFAQSLGGDEVLEAPLLSATEPTEPSVSESTDPDATVLYEMKEKREINVKHFRMSDGTTVAAVYPYAVHYENADGSLSDIDNRLSSSAFEGEEVFANAENEVEVKFKKKSNKNKLYTLKKDGFTVKVAIVGAEKVDAVLTENGLSASLEGGKFALSNLAGQVTYPELLPKVDVQLTAVSSSLKENIILKEAVDLDSILYEYHLSDGLEAVEENGRILLRKTSDESCLFALSAPAMWDAAGVHDPSFLGFGCPGRCHVPRDGGSRDELYHRSA